MYNNYVNWTNELTWREQELYETLDLDSTPIEQVNKYVDHYLSFIDLPIKERFSIHSICRVAACHQMNTYDTVGGPEEDHNPKALRRHWYHYFKMFAQEFSQQARNENIQESTWGIRWSGNLSQAYGSIVNQGRVTYKNLWVSDASRMMASTYSELYQNANILICVEKDSLFEDFKLLANKIGARAIYSGKGKSSKAAIEKLLDENFLNQYEPTITPDNPLIVLTITDYDYDGEKVISDTFPNQILRYIDADSLVYARCGIHPHMVDEADRQSSAYEIKMNNRKSKEWAYEKAMTQLVCVNNCTDVSYFGNASLGCPECSNELIPYVRSDEQPRFYGYEIEALRTVDYYEAVTRIVCEIIGIDTINSHLREECVPDVWNVADTITDDLLNNDTEYQEISKRLDEYRLRIRNKVRETIDPKQNDFSHLQDDSTVDQFVEHVLHRHSSYAFRPFSAIQREEALSDWFYDNNEDVIEDIKSWEY